MDESARLLVAQQQLEKDSDGNVAFFGLSVNETIRSCLLNGVSKKADKLKAEFKVSDKRLEPHLCHFKMQLNWMQILVHQASSLNIIEGF